MITCTRIGIDAEALAHHAVAVFDRLLKFTQIMVACRAITIGGDALGIQAYGFIVVLDCTLILV